VRCVRHHYRVAFGTSLTEGGATLTSNGDAIADQSQGTGLRSTGLQSETPPQSKVTSGSMEPSSLRPREKKGETMNQTQQEKNSPSHHATDRVPNGQDLGPAVDRPLNPLVDRRGLLKLFLPGAAAAAVVSTIDVKHLSAQTGTTPLAALRGVVAMMNAAATAAGVSIDPGKVDIEAQDDAIAAVAPASGLDDVPAAAFLSGVDVALVFLGSTMGSLVTREGQLLPNGSILSGWF
jgi:hypothetical protein